MKQNKILQLIDAMRKRFPGLFPVLAGLFLFLAADVFASGIMLLHYPQFEIAGSALIGENGSNLKEFEQTEDGLLVSMSDDPWIYYAFGEPVNVRFLSVETTRVSGPESDMQLYLMPSSGFRVSALQNGTITARFGLTQGSENVNGIRLDMAAVKDAAVSVERAVVNPRGMVILDAQRLVLRLSFLLALLLAELFGWMRLPQSRKKNFTAWAQLALKLGIFWLLCEPLFQTEAAGHAHVLCWMMLLSLEIFSIMALHGGASKTKNCYFLVIPLAFFYFSIAEYLNLTAFDFDSVEYLMLNLLFCALVPSVFLLIFRWGTFALSASTLIFAVWSAVNHYYGILRDNPLEYFDMANAKTAVNVVGNYSLTPDRETAAVLAAAAVVILVLAAAFGKRGNGYRWKSVAGNFIVVAAAAVIFYVKIPIFNNFSNLQIISAEKGYLLSFVSFIKMGQIKRPDGYQIEKADEILSAAKKEKLTGNSQSNMDRNPNVIVIMDEAFADLPSIYGFETNEDVLPNIHAMKENTIQGQLLVSVYGGGTANTEYEFLTGNSLHFLPLGCSPYVQYVGSHQQSLAWKLENIGYHAAAYHPYLAISYRRPEAYSHLGLSEFYSIESELPYDTCLRSYVSDESDFKNVIHLYEQREQGKPFFLFNVTMQNHGGYSAEEPEVEVLVRPTAEELQVPSLLEYLNLIYETDAAWKQLTDYFSEVEEDTIILMFGDHQPSMDSETNQIFDQIGMEQDGMLREERRYYSSFIMWANFEIEEAENMVTSPNYLRSLLLSQAGIELNAYEQFLMTLREDYPAMNAFGYLDAQGGWHSRDDAAGGGLQEYRWLLYQNVFDKKHANGGYYE